MIDADAALRGAIETTLAAQWPDVGIRSAANGTAALEIIQSGEVDLLISGMALESLGGIGLLRAAREKRRLADTYVILMTGAAAPEDLFAAIGEGADDCLPKPLRWAELVARVRAGLRRIEATRRHTERAEELQRLNDRHTEFLSMVSHEIRTPLSAILSAANVLLRYGSQRPESVERFARVIHQEGRRLTRLINNLLDLARIEAGHVDWSFSATAVDELVRDVQESFSALVGERSLTLVVESWPEAVVVTLDRDKVTQVLVNLVSNSIKHSPEGGEVRLRYRPHGDGVRLEVEDDGAGIPPGREEEIFNRFQQLGIDEQRRGSGLGLTISRQIVERHGGRIWAQPGRDHGALFVVELPGGSGGQGQDGSV